MGPFPNTACPQPAGCCNCAPKHVHVCGCMVPGPPQNQAVRWRVQESYGKDEEAAVQRVKEVYRQLDLEGLFK